MWTAENTLTSIGHVISVAVPFRPLIQNGDEFMFISANVFAIYISPGLSWASLFDFSDFPRYHPLYSTENKKVIGKFKDETHGIPIEELFGLRPKMYSLLYTENNKAVEKKVLKGITKYFTKQKIKHGHYKQCLFNQEQLTKSINETTS